MCVPGTLAIGGWRPGGWGGSERRGEGEMETSVIPSTVKIYTRDSETLKIPGKSKETNGKAIVLA